MISSCISRKTGLYDRFFCCIAMMVWITTVNAVLLATSTQAKDLSKGKPEAVGMISKRLQRINDVFQNEIDTGEFGAAEIIVARRNKVILHKKFSGGDEKNSTSEFELGSLSQPIIAVAALMLLEQGKFQMIEPVEKYLPEFTNILVYAQDGSGRLLKQSQPFTIQTLFTHTAGFSNSNNGSSIVAQQYHKVGLLEKRNLEQLVAALSEIPLQSQPGQEWQRSLSYDVLARLVEVFSGQGLHQYLTQQIFEPLQMSNSHVIGYNDQLIASAEDHQVAASDGNQNSNQLLLPQQAPSSYLETIRFQTSVEDYLRFATLLLNDGQLDRTRLIGPKTLELMTTNQIDKTEVSGLPSGINMGLGFFLLEDPAANGSYGNAGSYYWINDNGSMLWVDPDEQLVIVLAVHKSGRATDINKTVTAVVYSALKE